MLQECEEVQHEGESNLERRETPPRKELTPVFLPRSAIPDASSTQKLVHKESSKLTGAPPGDDDDAEGNGEVGSDNEDKKKKAPNMNRLLKTRLQKLVDKTDDKCVSPFMDYGLI